KPKAVLVGCGKIAGTWLDAVSKTPELELVALVDLHCPAAEYWAGKFNLPASMIYLAMDAALAATGAELVFDLTVPTAHESVVTAALKSGRHVLGEKPMSETLDSARRMIAAANAAGRTYAVMQNYRFNPEIRALHRFLGSDQIGPVEEVHVDFFIGGHFGGFRDEMAFPLLLDMSIHTFDMARFLTGADPVNVFCYSFNPKRSWYRGDASAIVIFELTGGIVFTYRASWCSEGQITPWNGQWLLVGSKGTVRWDGASTFKAQRVKPDAKPDFIMEQQSLDVPVTPMEATGHAGCMREFLSAVREGRPPETDCRDNIKSLAMVLAAVESAKARAKVGVTW
ncbi:MAG TPA: Gfo/Idh/MocA family oxidoreductase, partial [Tepidisphaeraceae bacterium]|nr:Gfo/Idh/MocA family oxidoreductase [Tepidisphaeraceae bacterium]